MKIVLQDEFRYVEIESDCGPHIQEIIDDLIRPALLGLGFTEGTLNEFLGEPS